MSKYITDNNGCGLIYGVEGEETVKQLSFPKFNSEIMITKEKEYYNVYIIHEAFQKEPLNNLHLQEPIEYGVPSDLQCEQWAIEYYLWYKHNKDFSITSEEIE
jgi:hypothetical protein